MVKHQRQGDKTFEPNTLYEWFRRNLHLFVLLGVVFLAYGILFVASPLGYNPVNSEKNATFPQAWLCSSGGQPFVPVTLPASREVTGGTVVTLKNNLPDVLIKGATLLLRTSQQDVEVFVSGERIYSTYEAETGAPRPTAAYHFVRLPVDCAGEEITVVFSSPFDNYAGFVNQMHIGSKASNIFFLLSDCGPRFFIGILVLAMGLMLMVIFSFTKEQGGRSALIFLGAFFFCAGFWVVAESKLLQFIIPYPVAVTNLSVFALSLLPVFSGLYYYKTHALVTKKVEKWVVVAVSAASLFMAIASCLDPTFPVRSLPYYIASMGLYVVYMSVAVILDGIKREHIFSTAVLGILAFGVCALMELVYYLSDTSRYNNSNLLTLGLLLFCIAMVVDSVQGAARISRTAIKADTLSVLAYTDSLTGLQNRAAFLEAVSAIEPNGEPGVTLGMFDLNHLKTVNDSFGHLVGDAMLRHSAKVIAASLRQEDKVYRIGGDEFVAILHHETPLDFDRLGRRICGEMDRENRKTLSYRLSIAYGYATFDAASDKTLYGTLARADEVMYRCKREQKTAELKGDPLQSHGEMER